MTLSYCSGDPIEIRDEAVRTELIAFLSKAGGTQGASTKGHYGPHYSLRVYFEGEEEPFIFSLWNDDHYSTSKHTDSEGYSIFFHDDLTDLYQYLQEKYPTKFWLSGAVAAD